MKKTDLGLWIGVVLCLAGALTGLAARHRVEASNRATALVVEASTVASLASEGGLPGALAELKSAGATGVSVGSVTLADLAAQGVAVVRADDSSTTVECPAEYREAVRAMALHRGWRATPLGETIVIEGAEPSAVPLLVVGLDRRQATATRAAGMQLVARITNSPGLDADSVRALVQDAVREGATSLLPSGDTVLGYRDALDALAEELAASGTIYLTPEFAKIAGDSLVAEMALPGVVRLHAIQQAEIDRMSPNAAIERYVKAVKERNIRTLLVRFPSLAGDGRLEQAARFLTQIRTSLIAEGSGVRIARPLSEPGIPALTHALTGLGIGLVAWWLLAGLAPGLAWAALGLVPVFTGLAWSSQRPLAAFGAALVLPCAAQFWVQCREGGIVARIAGGIGLPIIGGLCVGSMLADLPHMLSLSVFPGVKAAQALPILFAVFLAIRAQGGAGKLFRKPVLWGDAILVLVGLGALGFMLVRSGNDNPAAVSGLELQFRDLLERVLYTRPRTKEFLLGNPALVTGALLALRRPGNAWASVFFVLGAIGQTSITNTFCHLHTPVLLSVARVGSGIVLGGIIGIVVWSLAVKRLWPERERIS